MHFGKFVVLQPSSLLYSPPNPFMKNHILTIGFVVSSLSAIASPAFAQTVPVPTMNQPDNGFFEGPSPEWAVLHSTDWRGTETHRQYHRDAVRAHLSEWHKQNRTSDRSNTVYEIAHRNIHQERNELHRLFHTAGPLSQ